ncbi:HAMP domain-containing histidine kinase [Candidatus Daviesbacteria bacterium]|nr:HAMP domain-containing histidine kinase [Candidatus Daviesbacteria bacterium]
MSRLLVRKIFKPIRSLTEIISATDLNKLDNTLQVKGNKSDELVILGDKFNEMMVRLKSMSEQQKEFITNVSHELKTPLSRAISSFDLLLLSKSDHQVLKDVRNDLFEINNLLDKLMFLSKLRPGTILPSDKISLNQLIQESLILSEKELKNKEVSVVLDLGSDATIFIPKEYAKVLLGNLLSNAIKYSKENSTVSIQTQKVNNKITLTITDQGIGIRKSDLKRIGEKFYRGIDGKKAFGHGIGLSIVKRIADLYKIGLSIYSEIGEGTRAVLEFPTY